MSQTVLFLCPHNAAKGVIAAAYFQQAAEQLQLDFNADSAGTDPAEKVYPSVVQLLQTEGIEVTGYQPRHVTVEDLTGAACVISMGCELSDLPAVPARFERWDDVPMASQDLPGVQKTLKTHTRLLAERLKAEQ